MADRSVKVTVGADVSPLKRAMQDGSRSVDGLSGSITKTGTAGTSAFEKLGNGAKTLAKGIGATEVVLGGLYASALKTGIGFNSLQQSSRAALTAIMGSAEAANRQMDELFKFTQTSPLPKEAYIEAQQTLLGFGVEASKVVPILKAIDDATIAIGGSAQDVGELAQVFGKIQSQGKITGRELMQLGMRGIDAATMIADEMGTTADVIRDQISKSAIDADTALSTLAAGMEKKFGGASELVKQQFTGAVDRMKAAWRDLGSELAKDLVDPVSGGKLVVWLNDVADLIRAMTPAVSTLHDAFMSAFTGPGIHSGLQSLVTWFKELDPAQVQAFASRLGELAPIISAVGAASLTMATSNLPVIGGLMKAIGPLPAALAAAAAASPELRRAIMDLLSAASPLLEAFAKLSGALLEAGQSIIDAGSTLLTSLVPAVQAVSALLTPIVTLVAGMAHIFDALPSPVKTATAALLAFALLRGPLSGMLTGITAAFRGFGEQMALQKSLAAAAGTELTRLQAAVATTQARMSGLGAVLAKGGLLAGGLVVVGMIADSFADAARNAQAFESAVNGLTQALIDNGGEWDAQIQRQREMEVIASDVFKALIAGGADYGETLRLLTGDYDENTVASESFQRAVQGLSISQVEQLGGMVSVRQEAEAGARAYLDNADAAKEMASATGMTIAELRTLPSAQDDARASAVAAAAAWREYRAATSDAADETKTAEERLKELSLALRGASGVNAAHTRTIDGIFDATQDLADSMAKAKRAADDQKASLVTNSGQLRTTSADARDLRAKMMDYAATSYDTIAAIIEQTGSMEAGRAAAQRIRQSFIDMAMTQMNLTRPQAQALAQEIGILQSQQINDKTFTITAIDRATPVFAGIAEMLSALSNPGAFVKSAWEAAKARASALSQLSGLSAPGVSVSSAGGGTAGGGGGGGGGGSKSLSEEAKKAAKAAEDAKKAHKSLGDDIKAIQKASTGSVADMRKAMSQLREDMKVAGENKKAIAETKVLEQQLVKAMQMREQVTKQLEDAQKRLNDLTKAYADRVAAVQSAIVSKSADVVGTYDSLVKAAQDLADAQNKAAKEAGETTTEITAQAVSIGDLVSKMQEQLGALKDWATNIEALRGKGLNNTALQQLIDAGPQAAESAALLAGASQSQIAEINRITDETSAIGEKIGTLSAESMYGQGITAAEKLVEGLTDRQKLIKDTISDLAKGVKVLKKKDMKDQGIDAMTSLIKGLRSQSGPLTDTMRDLANSALAAFRASLTGDDTSATGKIATGGKVKGAATGGWVAGGTIGKDSVPIMTMPGEAIIPAANAAANRPIVNALINGQQIGGGGGPVYVTVMLDSQVLGRGVAPRIADEIRVLTGVRR